MTDKHCYKCQKDTTLEPMLCHSCIKDGDVSMRSALISELEVAVEKLKDEYDPKCCESCRYSDSSRRALDDVINLLKSYKS